MSNSYSFVTKYICDQNCIQSTCDKAGAGGNEGYISKSLHISQARSTYQKSELMLTLSPMGGASSGIGDCSKTHLLNDLKRFDFSYISKTKILK